MAIEFDPAKDAANIAKHGVSLAKAADLDISVAVTAQDTRFAYGEDRFIAIGPVGADLHVLVYTLRGENVRAISLRPANEKEKARWLTK